MENIEYIPISELERKNAHWFSQDSKRFFKSLWDSHALKNPGSVYAYFISSEKHEAPYSHINEPRKYTIRKMNLRTGDFATTIDGSIFDFQRFDTKKQAEKALRDYLKTEPILTEKIDAIQREIDQLKYEESRIAPKMQKLISELAEITQPQPTQ